MYNNKHLQNDFRITYKGSGNMGLNEIRKNKGITFDSGPSIYWSDIEKINWLQRRVIVNSIIYYEFNSNVIPDDIYDILSHQLKDMQDLLSEEELSQTKYGYIMKGFSGSGFDLHNKLSLDDYADLSGIAINVIELDKHKIIQMEKERQNLKSLLEVEIEEVW